MKWIYRGLCGRVLGGALLLSGEAKGINEDLRISLEGESPAVMAVRESLAVKLAAVKPEPKAPRALVRQDGGYVLSGDLFKTGGCFALLETMKWEAATQEEDRSTMALAEWTDGKWELRELWKIPLVWRPKEWDRKNDYLPVTPSTQPFELVDFNDDGVPEVIVAGEVSKYFQFNYLMEFNLKSKQLELVGGAMAPPKKVGKYVRLYTNSGHLAVWQEWSFCEWKEGKLVEKAA